LTFTKKVVTAVTIVWIVEVIYSAIMIWWACKTTQNFSYLDTFISDSGETFRLIVGANIISKTLENVFKYNEGGIFGTSIKPPRDEEPSEEEPMG
jgi:hypothetical protein